MSVRASVARALESECCICIIYIIYYRERECRIYIIYIIHILCLHLDVKRALQQKYET
jgi:hypothetical protein